MRHLARRFDPDWVGEYAAKAAVLKDCLGADGLAPRELVRTVQTALKRVYRAVAFDIDGTLTPEGSSAIDPGAAEAVGELLQRGVHVILITGRSDKSSREATEAIREHARLSDWYLRRLSCAVENGSALLATSSEFPTRFLNDRVSISMPIPNLESLKSEVEEVIQEKLPQAATVKKKNNSLRIEVDDASKLEGIRELLQSVICKYDGVNLPLFLSSGNFATKTAFSITATNKQLALDSIAARYGILADHILRIGDQGAEGGNDFELLDSPSGFSVGSLSKSHHGCLPVLDDELGAVGKAATASRRLTSLLNLFPSVSMSPSWNAKHTQTVLDFEKLALARSRDENETITQRLRVRLRYLVGQQTNQGRTVQLEVEDLFDPLSGAVRFKDWEFSELPALKATSFFTRQLPGREPESKAPWYAWSMYSDTGLLLRGPNYYYELAQSLRHEQSSVSSYVLIVRELVDSAIESLKELLDCNHTLPLFKLVLGFADNLRNAWITLQYAGFLADRNMEDSSFPCTRAAYSTLLLPHTRQHFNLLLNQDVTWHTGLTNYIQCLEEISAELDGVCNGIEKGFRNVDTQAGIIRKWRESDHFLQNVTAVQLGLHEFQQRGDFGVAPLVFCGILYGGTELASVAQVVAEARNLPCTAALAQLSVYRQEAVGDRVRAGDSEYVEDFVLSDNHVCVLDQQPLNGRLTVLLDDNITTGTTLQLARDLVVVCGGDVIGAITVGFSGSNRLTQMAMPNHGFVDPDLLFGFVRGLITPTPYSRLLIGAVSGKKLVDQTGIFNKARFRIERHIKKNWLEGPEVPDESSVVGADLPHREGTTTELTGFEKG